MALDDRSYEHMQNLLLVISPWTTCFMRDIRVFGTRLQELEGLHPDALAS